MKTDWSPLHTELSHWRAAHLTPQIWWRDDDAISMTAALEILIELQAKLGVPSHLAVIPKHADQTLVTLCKAEASIVPLVHGWAHENRAPEGQKKAEFGHPRPQLTKDAAHGLACMEALFGDHLLRCFVPPWNRITPDLTSALGKLGFNSLSTFTPRPARVAASGLVQINTHIDPIYWRGGGGLADASALIELAVEVLEKAREAGAECPEPLGVLTHHLVQDAQTWAFTEGLLSVLLEGGAEPLNLFDLKDNLP